MSDSSDRRDDGVDAPPPGNGAAAPSDPSGHGASREDEVSLLDILLVLARHKRLIVRTVLAFVLLGLTYALLAPRQYTSDAVVVRESQEGGGGLPSGLPTGALSGLGINLGGASSGLTPAAFPKVLQSREVRLGVVRDTFHFPGLNQPTTFVEYANRPSGLFSLFLKYTIRLPWTLKELLVRATSGAPVAAAGTTEAGAPVVPTEEENQALKAAKGLASTEIDEETGLMTISVTTTDPQLASALTKSFVHHLTVRVQEIRTEKTRRRLSFVERRFQEAEQELENAEDRLAQFLERNQNPTTATLQFQRDRLQRQVRFKEQLYSDLQGQLTQIRLDLRRQQPVVTTLEEAVPPTEPSAPQELIILLVSLASGVFFGVVFAFMRALLVPSESRSTSKHTKLQELVDTVKSGRLV